jgi:hypothetical protein
LLIVVVGLLQMPHRLVCNGTEQKSPEAKSGLGLVPSRRASLHNNTYNIMELLYGIDYL